MLSKLVELASFAKAEFEGLSRLALRFPPDYNQFFYFCELTMFCVIIKAICHL